MIIFSMHIMVNKIYQITKSLYYIPHYPYIHIHSIQHGVPLIY